MTNKEAIEKIAEYLYRVWCNAVFDSFGIRPAWSILDENDKAIWRENAIPLGKDLASLGYVQKAKDQSLPENPFEGYFDVTENIRMAKSQGFERYKHLMLTPDKDGCVWIKVKKEMK